VTETKPRKLDVGCGRDKLPDAIGIDSNPRSHADIIHDLDVRPWPIPDSSIDYVRAQDVLEHVSDFFGVMAEIFRVCRDGATVDVRMPFMSSLNFATDPTHRRAGTSGTFDYFDPRTAMGRYAYTESRFELIEFRYGRFYHGLLGKLFKFFDRFWVPYFQRNRVMYEHYFAYVYPMHDISYRLRVVKKGEPAA
jgi:ubiquinone/menaquinone biosynthesis C-methylase UbiE